MMRVAILAVCVVSALAARPKHLKLPSAQLIEGQDAVTPTGVFQYLASIPQQISSWGILSPQEVLTNIEACPAQSLVGRLSLYEPADGTADAYGDVCYVSGMVMDAESEDGTTDFTFVEGDYDYWANTCTFSVGDIEYKILLDGDQYIFYHEEGNVFQECFSRYVAENQFEGLAKYELYVQPNNIFLGDFTIEQTTQGFYKILGELVMPARGQDSANNTWAYEETHVVDLAKYSGFGDACPNLDDAEDRTRDAKLNGPGKQRMRNGTVDLNRIGCSSSSHTAAPFGGSSVWAFNGVAKFRNWATGERDTNQFGVFVTSLEANRDLWAVLTVQADFSSGGLVSLGEYFTHIYQRIDTAESRIALQKLKNTENKNTDFYYHTNAKQLDETPANNRRGKFEKSAKKRSYQKGNKKTFNRKRRQQRKIRQRTRNMRG